MTFGGGGGGGAVGGGNIPSSHSGAGGNGGGIIFLVANTLTNLGTINANGGNGGGTASTGAQTGSGGGGAGGSILLKAQTAILGSGLITASGGLGAFEYATGGGNGSDGRIRVEYCNSLSGSTNPAASTQKLTCYIAEKTDAAAVYYTVPDTVTSPGQNYVMQFARRLAFAGAGNQLTYTRVVSQTYASATMDALITNVGAGGATTLTVDFGDDGTIDYTYNGNITQPTTLNIPNVASAFNAYITTHTASGGNVDVPIRVNINRQADVMLTNFGVTPGAGLDLVVNPGDLVLGCPGGPSCLASEGDTVPVTVNVHNTGAQNAASAVVGYYACTGVCGGVLLNAPTGGRLLGNSYVATIPAGGTATANFNWNTEGFTHTQTLFAFVDPPNAIAETLETNNIVSTTLYIKTKPDLRVASIGLSSTDRVAGEPITATLVISNTGETATSSSTNVTRINEWGERGDSSSQELTTGAIAATSSVTLTTLLSPILFGTHTITVTADASNVITESVETNNVMTRTVLVGLPAQSIDAGVASDLAYSASRGFGWLNGSTYDFGGATITKTVRYDGNGALQYRFDGLQPNRFYHLDATFYQEGDTFNQKVSFDGIDSGKVLPLADGQTTTTSLVVPSAAYSDGTMIVTFQRQSGGSSAPTRFRDPKSSIGPAFVSQLALTPIEYIYLDAGGANDVAYDAARGYGYYGGNTYASGLGGSDAVSTYRSAFGNQVYYKFDALNPAKSYVLNVTMYDGTNSTRVQGVSMDSNPVADCWNLSVNSIRRLQCPIDPARYASDGSVIVGVICASCNAPRLNEIALEEKTRDIITPTIQPTPTPTPTATPTGGTSVSAFAAQWSASVVQVTWSTLSESRTDNFQLWRSPTLNPAAWTLVRTQPSQSNCASSTTPYSYGYTDNSVVAGQTYYYKLTWSGDTCGGAAGAYSANAVAYPYANLSLSSGWNLISLPISSTIGYTAESIASAINAQGGNCTEVDRWLNGGWDSHVQGLPFNDFAINQATGYFLKCTKLGTWSFQGNPFNQAMPLNLFAGWNLVGIPYAPTALTAESMSDEMNTQGGNCAEVDRWLNGGWDSHLNGLPFNDFAAETTKGYWL